MGIFFFLLIDYLQQERNTYFFNKKRRILASTENFFKSFQKQGGLKSVQHWTTARALSEQHDTINEREKSEHMLESLNFLAS